MARLVEAVPLIETTGIDNHSEFTVGWLNRYCEAVSHTRFPPSFHVLCGLFALSSIVGRRARIVRPSYTLYPPISILLLGLSGVGKSQSLKLARRVIELACSCDLEFKARFHCLHAHKFSPRGLMDYWAKWQAEQASDGNATPPIEGTVTVNELSAILTSTTGNENAAQWIIDVLEHDEISAFTGYRGRTLVHDVTVAFGMCAPLDELRETVTVRQFANGFMHRFLVAHETKKPEHMDESRVDFRALNDLAIEAFEIRDAAPDTLIFDAGADALLRAQANRAEGKSYTTVYLSGFWNRFEGMCAKVAGVRALSDHRSIVTAEDVKAARLLIEERLYPPLATLVDELSMGRKMADIFRIADDLYFAGPDGMEALTLKRKIPATTIRAQADLISLIKKFGLLYERKGRFYRLKEWAEDGDSDSSHDGNSSGPEPDEVDFGE